MSKIIPTLEDFPANKPNCGNCSRKGGICYRTKSNKTMHNGLIFGVGGDVTGIIYCCPHYTGYYQDLMNDLFT